MHVIVDNIGNFTDPVNGYLTARPARDRRSYYRSMLAGILTRIEKRLKAVGLSSAAASRKAGLSADAIRNIERAIEGDGRQGVSTYTLQHLAPVLQTTVAWLVEGVGPEEGPPLVRIIGRVGADSEGRIVQTTGQETWDMAGMPPGGTADTVALEVRGHSMRGYADDGALIYFEDQRTPPSRSMLGHIVICETADGQVLIKRLLKGSAPDLYDLESINGPTLEDQRLAWAAHVTAVIPPAKARQIIIRSEAA